MDEVHKTRKLEPDQIVTISSYMLNREMVVFAEEMREVREQMVTKKDLWRGLGIGLTIATIVISLISIIV